MADQSLTAFLMSLLFFSSCHASYRRGRGAHVSSPTSWLPTTRMWHFVLLVLLVPSYYDSLSCAHIHVFTTHLMVDIRYHALSL